jgi:hypothetical protein
MGDAPAACLPQLDVLGERGLVRPAGVDESDHGRPRQLLGATRRAKTGCASGSTRPWRTSATRARSCCSTCGSSTGAGRDPCVDDHTGDASFVVRGRAWPPQ